MSPAGFLVVDKILADINANWYNISIKLRVLLHTSYFKK